MAKTKPILEAAVALRGAASNEWDALMLALQTYVIECADDMVSATPDNLVRAQGYAQSARQMHTMLLTAPEQLELLRAAEKKRLEKNR